MAQRKVILEDLEALSSLKELAESYEEIAVIRMQKLKDSVLRTRNFLADISDVFVDLKASHLREIAELLEKRRKDNANLPPELQKKGKLLMVYLSSNTKFYGAITQKTFRLFLNDVRKPSENPPDVVVIGKVGKELYDAIETHTQYEFFDLPDNNVDIEYIKKLVNKFLQYEKVLIYYGKFGNVVKQIPFSTSITGDDIFETEIPTPTPREDRFIFEPILEKIFHFFETQIMANLFGQTLLENQLARHSSRVNAMEEALIHIEEESKKLTLIKNRLRQQTENIKQLETISGMALWED